MVKKVLNVKELKDYLSISESTVRKLVREKKIPHFRIATKILFDQEVIDKWLDEQQEKNSTNI